MKKHDYKSKQLYTKAKRVMPGGVNSPVRSCRSVGLYPLFIQAAKGSHLETVDNIKYIDYMMSWGALIIGHAHRLVIQQVIKAVKQGVSYGAPCRAEIELAEIITHCIPSMEMIRMVNSGTEATMSAIRLARAYTNRDKVIKFIGCYHGHSDAFLAQAGSGLLTLSIPESPGVSKETIKNTLLAQYNDINQVEKLFQHYPNQIAAVIVEPVPANMGLLLPEKDFLRKLRILCSKYNALLIFDEVVTGFRITYGSVGLLYGVAADLICLGKIIGGGFPVGAYGGKKEIMKCIAPEGKVYQAGTFSGNPVTMTAGIATLHLLASCDYSGLEKKTKHLCQALCKILAKKGYPVQYNQIASMFSLFFCDKEKINNFLATRRSDVTLYTKYYAHMRNHKIYLVPSSFETNFTSFMHSDLDYKQTLQAAERLEKL